MEYVMIPVPEEYVVDVMQYVARLVVRASVVPWTKESIEEFFDEIEEASRSLLSFVARATVANKDASEEEAAQTLELSTREVKAITREINDEAHRGRFEPLLGVREASIVLPNGRTVQRHFFTMNDGVARMIRAHERSSLSEAPVTGAPAE